jgi:hypothetical protein
MTQKMEETHYLHNEMQSVRISDSALVTCNYDLKVFNKSIDQI